MGSEIMVKCSERTTYYYIFWNKSQVINREYGYVVVTDILVACLWLDVVIFGASIKYLKVQVFTLFTRHVAVKDLGLQKDYEQNEKGGVRESERETVKERMREAIRR